MATAAKSLTRFATRASLRSTAQSTSALVARQATRSSRRGYNTKPSSLASSSTALYLLGSAAIFGGGGYYLASRDQSESPQKTLTARIFKPTQKDYQKVYDLIAKELEEKDEYDDGSYGPVIVRLAWHCSGTYDKETGTGGSNGATMRFDPEADHGANGGLKNARDFLEPVKKQFPWISYSDLWTLAGVCAIQEMRGPAIPWRPGRVDRDVAFCTPDGRLPDAAKGQDHLRQIFYRMGWNDQEIVALSGAHALGRCHTNNSGFEGPWTFSPTIMSNDYFRLLVEEKWDFRKWKGPKQYEDRSSKSLMMLPTDMALVNDKEFFKHVERYAEDGQAFYRDFASVFMRLLELGVPFESKPEDRMVFNVLDS